MKVASSTPRFQYNRDPIYLCLQATFAQPSILMAIGCFFLGTGTVVMPVILSSMNEFVKQNARIVRFLPVPGQYQIDR